MSWIKSSCNAPGLSKQKYEPKNHKYYFSHVSYFLSIKLNKYLPNPIKHIKNNAISRWKIWLGCVHVILQSSSWLSLTIDDEDGLFSSIFELSKLSNWKF